MKKALRFSTMLLCLLMLTSCHNQKNAEKPSKTDSSSISVTETTPVTETTLASESQSSDVVIVEYGPAYKEEVEKYGDRIAAALYKWRANGNPNLLSTECVPYHSGEGGFVIEPIQKEYAANDKDSKWGVDIISVSDEIDIIQYSEYLNLEKNINGEWVRQAVLDVERLSEQYPIAREITDSMRKKDLLDSLPTISVSEVSPEVTSGQYRFIFYVRVRLNGKLEYRMYYVPFTVTE